MPNTGNFAFEQGLNWVMGQKCQ